MNKSSQEIVRRTRGRDTDAFLKQRKLTQEGTAGADTLQGSDSLSYADVLKGGAGRHGTNAANDGVFEIRVAT